MILKHKLIKQVILPRWYIRCSDGYRFNVDFTDFNIEAELDRVVLFSVDDDGTKKLLAEVNSVGKYQTDSNQLLIIFHSDCDLSMRGFRAVVSVVEIDVPQTTTTAPLETTAATLQTTAASLETTESIPCKLLYDFKYFVAGT